MTLNEALNKGRKDRVVILHSNVRTFKRNPVITCTDGYSISIQCGVSMYCNPREDILDVEGYTEFELGFPNQLDSLLTDYAEEGDTTQTIFTYVPRQVVEDLIAKHGGIEE